MARKEGCDLLEIYGMGRDPQTGHFTPRNHYSGVGGTARKYALSPERRKEISSLGFWGLVNKWFHGDKAEAVKYLGALGAWASEKTAYEGDPIYKPHVFRRPVAPWEEVRLSG